MPCDRCGAEPPPGEAYSLTPRGKLCRSCVGAPRFPTRCQACSGRYRPEDSRSRVRRVGDRDLCGYCADATASTAARARRRGWRR
jgi:hypothetical protein